MSRTNSVRYFNHIGNLEFLSLYKRGFLCSRKVPAEIILKCYDWAIEQREKGVCVISGYHSKIEKDVFHYLAKGKQPIIEVLTRGMKNRFNPVEIDLLSKNQLLIISPFTENIKRVTRETTYIRNKYIIENADDIFTGYIDPGGQLQEIINEVKGIDSDYFKE